MSKGVGAGGWVGAGARARLRTLTRTSLSCARIRAAIRLACITYARNPLKRNRPLLDIFIVIRSYAPYQAHSPARPGATLHPEDSERTERSQLDTVSQTFALDFAKISLAYPNLAKLILSSPIFAT